MRRGLSRWVDTGSLSTLLTRLVINVILPMLILYQVPNLRWNDSFLVPVALHWAALLASVFAVHVVSKLFRFERATQGALLLLVPLGNTSFMGIPLVEALFGANGVPYAIMYDQFGSFLAVSTYGLLIAAYYGRQNNVGWALLVKRALYFPPFMTLIIALLLPVDVWEVVFVWIEPILHRGAQLLMPCAMLAIGMQLRVKLPSATVKPLLIGLGLKLWIIPGFALGLLWISSGGGIAASVSILQMAMPPMITAAILAIDNDLDSDLSVAMSGIGIVASCFSLPVFYYLIGV